MMLFVTIVGSQEQTQKKKREERDLRRQFANVVDIHGEEGFDVESISDEAACLVLSRVLHERRGRAAAPEPEAADLAS